MLLVAIFASSAGAQQKIAPKKAQPKPVQSKPGQVSGRVFAITESGDLKPARLAKIYLFYLPTSTNSTQDADRDSEEALNTAGMAWLKAQTKAARERLEETIRDVREGRSLTDALKCRRELLTEDAALIETLEWGESAKRPGQILTADADEEGNFKVASVRPGRYILVARGRAGFNDALWVNNSLTVEPGTEVTVKLASPQKTCLSVQ
jgi:hypothetical protein